MIRSLQAGRAVAALLVVLLHTSGGIFALPKYFDGSPFGRFFAFGTAGVDFFFVLSGFIIAHVHGGDIGRPDRLRPYFWKRFTRVYPAYWAALLPLLPVFLLMPGIGKGYESDLYVILCSFLLFPMPDIGPVLGVAWSMCYEVLFYLLFGALIASRRWGGLLFAAWVGLLAVAVCGQFWTYPLSFLANLYNLEFLAGIGLAVALRRVTVPVPRVLMVLGAALFLATGMVDVYVQPLGMHLHVLGYTSGSLLALGGAIQAERSGKLKVPQPLVFLGDASYSIYLVHFPALSLLAKTVKSLGIDQKVPKLALFFALAGAAVLCGCLFHAMVERPLLQWLRGERKPKATEAVLAGFSGGTPVRRRDAA
jgi:peptidoglycan/LPS O-acetylase OafA/YrhL